MDSTGWFLIGVGLGLLPTLVCTFCAYRTGYAEGLDEGFSEGYTRALKRRERE